MKGESVSMVSALSKKDIEPFCSLQHKQLLYLPSNYTVKHQKLRKLKSLRQPAHF